MKSLCIFCGSSPGNDRVLIQEIKKLMAFLAQENWSVVYGGASVGIMGLVADEALKNNMKVTGVLPKNFQQKEIAHAGLSKLILVDTMHERKFKMYELSDAFLVLPGGLGTLDELFEITTWKQIGFHKKPIGIWNYQGYYDSLLKFLEHSKEKGFVPQQLSGLLIANKDYEALIRGFINI